MSKVKPGPKEDVSHIGIKYNFLKIVSSFRISGIKKKSSVKWFVCKCDCGNIKKIRSAAVLCGDTKSCGCKKHVLRVTAIKKQHPNAIENMYYDKIYRRSAKQHNKKFLMTFDVFLDLIKKPCVYCGSEPKLVRFNKKKDESRLVNGIDRIDSSIGYENGNIVTCCRTCNMMKNVLSRESFLEHVNRINNHQMNMDGDNIKDII